MRRVLQDRWYVRGCWLRGLRNAARLLPAWSTTEQDHEAGSPAASGLFEQPLTGMSADTTAGRAMSHLFSYLFPMSKLQPQRVARSGFGLALVSCGVPVVRVGSFLREIA